MQKTGDEFYLQRCLQLAKLAAGNAAPNPMVGAVLVWNDTIIGEGYHHKFGGSHAEVHCINEALKNHPEKITQSTLYVSLEPCAHHGKTPPCADLIIRNKIPKVVVACRDSFKEVDGKGIEKLQKAGIEVTVGVCEKEAIELNKAFFCFHGHKRPYVVLKWAQTADGFMARNSDERLLISNEYSNKLVHKWRSEQSAIMVGANTAMLDNPLLNNRNWFGPQPKKILFDPNLKAPEALDLFQGNDVVVILNTLKDAVAKNRIYLKIDPTALISDGLAQLYHLSIQSVLVEGGRKLLQSFINSGLWDEAIVITNKELFIGSGLSAPVLINQQKIVATHLMTDEIVKFKNNSNPYIHAAT